MIYRGIMVTTRSVSVIAALLTNLTVFIIIVSIIIINFYVINMTIAMGLLKHLLKKLFTFSIRLSTCSIIYLI